MFNRLAELPDESVHCAVTSPPYFALRDYGVEGAIGLEPTFDEHLEVMVRVFREVRRVLRKDGTLCLNYGDAYAGSTNGRSAADTKALGKDDRTFRDKPFSTVGGVFKPKDLMMMPGRVAMALQADGCDVAAARAIDRAMERIAEACGDAPIPDRVRVTLEALRAEYAEAKGHSWWLRSRDRLAQAESTAGIRERSANQRA